MEMSNGEDWLLRPVLEGLVSYTALESTELTLLDFAIMNEALDVRSENQFRFEKAMTRGRR